MVMMGHAEMIGNWAGKEIAAKYRRGQIEHGGNVTRKPVLRHIQEEAMDTMVYVAVAQQQMLQIDHLLMVAETCPMKDRLKYVKKARNIIATGNTDGIMEEENDEVSYTEMYSEKFSNHINRQMASEVLDG